MANQELRVNSDRLQQLIADFAAIGGTDKGGVTRLALSDEDKVARDLLIQKAKDAGCSIKIDAFGNIFMRRAGKNNDLAPVLVGSHGDSQPKGGRFDGIYGILGGLELIYTLNDHHVETLRPIDLVMWTNEEGARFAPAMIGSAVFVGASTLEFGLSRADANGVTMGDELVRIGYNGSDGFSNYQAHAAFELHIEQGPLLENNQIDIGIVTGTQGQKWYEVTLTGLASHAGTTPMDIRKDALLGLAEAVSAVNKIGLGQMPDGRATVGMVRISPNSRNVIPGEAWFSAEFRHPSEQALIEMDQQLHQVIKEIADRNKLQSEVKSVLTLAPIQFDQSCIAAVQKSVQTLGYSHQNIISGAGHDACHLASVAPTSMIFTPCINGLSHNEAEDITPEWAEAGANVLLHAILSKARE